MRLWPLCWLLAIARAVPAGPPPSPPPDAAPLQIIAAGTLGSLIPPSVLFIIYGIFTETSISQLFLAGILPGLVSLLGETREREK